MESSSFEQELLTRAPVHSSECEHLCSMSSDDSLDSLYDSSDDYLEVDLKNNEKRRIRIDESVYVECVKLMNKLKSMLSSFINIHALVNDISNLVSELIKTYKKKDEVMKKEEQIAEMYQKKKRSERIGYLEKLKLDDKNERAEKLKDRRSEPKKMDSAYWETPGNRKSKFNSPLSLKKKKLITSYF